MTLRATSHNINVTSAAAPFELSRLLDFLGDSDKAFIASPFTDESTLLLLISACQRSSRASVQILLRDPRRGRFPAVETDRALRRVATLHTPGIEIRVVGKSPSFQGGLFHAKFWWFRSRATQTLFMGSANLNRASWNSSAEAGAWLEGRAEQISAFMEPWFAAWHAAEDVRSFVQRYPPLEDSFPEYGGDADRIWQPRSSFWRDPIGRVRRLLRRVFGSRQAFPAPPRERQLGAPPPEGHSPQQHVPAGPFVGPNEPNELRPYQQTLIDSLDELYARRGTLFSGLLILPTGGGKTRIVTTWAVESFVQRGKRVLWLAHRDELLRSARSEFERLGVHPNAINVVTSDSREWGGNVVLTMTPTLRVNKNVLRQLRDQPFSLVVFDEAHHALAEKTFVALQHLRARGRSICPVLGMTATPFRNDTPADEFPQRFFDAEKIVGPNFATLVREGCVARPVWVALGVGRPRRVAAESIRGADFNSAFLERFGASDEVNREAVRVWVEGRSRYGPTLVFAVDIEHGLALLKRFQAAGVQAEFVDHETPAERRRGAIDAFKSGRLTVMINCGVFTEGTDIPEIRTVLLARPTMSLVLYLQMIGRGARLAPGKTTFAVLDVTDNIQTFGANEWASTARRVEETLAE